MADTADMAKMMDMANMDAQKKHVCVIGAGMAGLITARHLASKASKVAFDVLEKSGSLGGTWVAGDNSAMYDNLICNLPWPVMATLDFPPPKATLEEAFWPKEKVLEYLEDYAEHFNLKPKIKFNTEVVLVDPVDADERFCQWKVVSRDTLNGDLTYDVYDAVVVAVGNYSHPRLPEISNLHLFQGKILHSKDYRKPEDLFRSDGVQTKIICLGGRNSSVDIALELFSTGADVVVSHRNAELLSLPPKMAQSSSVITCTGKDSFLTQNGEELKDVDVMLFCTGYVHKYPFLSDKSGVRVIEDGSVVADLYRQGCQTVFLRTKIVKRGGPFNKTTKFINKKSLKVNLIKTS